MKARRNRVAEMEPLSVAQFAWRHARRVAVLIIGSSVVLVGFVLFLTPGPATVVIPVGLMILATEFAWARRILKRLKKEAMNVVNAVSGKKDEPPAGEPRD